MAQDYGAAQPIMDWVKEFVVTPVQKTLDTINKIPLPEKSESDYSSKPTDRGTSLKSVAAYYGVKRPGKRRTKAGRGK